MHNSVYISFTSHSFGLVHILLHLLPLFVAHLVTMENLSHSLVSPVLQPASALAGGSEGSEDSTEDESSGEESNDSSESEEEDDDDGDKGDEEKEEENEPLSLEWPDTRRKQATYLFLLPIVFPLWLTLPDVRNPVSILIISRKTFEYFLLCFSHVIRIFQASRKYFVITFIGCILWIAVFSYLMVWWAHQVG